MIAFGIMHPTFQLQMVFGLFLFFFGCGSEIQHRCRILLEKKYFRAECRDEIFTP